MLGMKLYIQRSLRAASKFHLAEGNVAETMVLKLQGSVGGRPQPPPPDIAPWGLGETIDLPPAYPSWHLHLDLQCPFFAHAQLLFGESR